MDASISVNVLSCNECFCRLKPSECEELCHRTGLRLCTSCLKQKPVWKTLDILCEVHGVSDCRARVPFYIHCQTVRRKYDLVQSRLLLRLFSKSLHLSLLHITPMAVFVECAHCCFGASVIGVRVRPWSAVSCPVCKSWTCVRCSKLRDVQDHCRKSNLLCGQAGIWQLTDAFVRNGAFSCGCVFTPKDLENELVEEMSCIWKTASAFESAYMVSSSEMTVISSTPASDFQMSVLRAAESAARVCAEPSLLVDGPSSSHMDMARLQACLQILDWLADVSVMTDETSVRVAMYVWLQSVPVELGVHALSLNETWQKVLYRVPELRS